jgi:transposase-like protein
MQAGLMLLVNVAAEAEGRREMVGLWGAARHGPKGHVFCHFKTEYRQY